MKRNIIFLLIALLGISFSTHAQTLHAILLGDTKDSVEEFAESCKADLTIMNREVNFMAESAKLKPEIHEIRDENFTSAQLKKIASSLQIGSDDIVLVYYSGAGFCEKGKPEDERALRMGLDDDDIISTAEVLSIIQPKDAGLNILMVDACALVREVAMGPDRGDVTEQFYQSLLSACGTVKVFSSKCSEYSFGDEKGGFFTNSYIEAVDHYIDLEYESVTWNNLLAYASKLTAQKAMTIFRNQHPVFFFSEDFKDVCEP